MGSYNKNFTTGKMSTECKRGIRTVFLIVLILAVAINMMPDELALDMVIENGPVELLTAVGYFCAAFWLILLPLFQPERKTASSGVMVLLLGLRELDFHSKFTTMGVLKSRYYLSPEVPVVEKTIVSVLMIALLIVAIRFLQLNYRKFLEGIKAREATAINAGLAIAIAVASKIMDSNSASMHWIAALYHDNPALSMQINEEVIELAVPLFFLLAVFHLTKNRKT